METVLAQALPLEQLPQATSGAIASPPTGGVAPSDAARFAELMAKPATAVPPPQSVSGPAAASLQTAVSPPPPVGQIMAQTLIPPPEQVGPISLRASGQPKSLGDAILNGLSNVSEDFKHSWEAVNAALAGPELSLPKLMKVQLSMIELGLQFELLGKGISRSTQNIDQLTKLQ